MATKHLLQLPSRQAPVADNVPKTLTLTHPQRNRFSSPSAEPGECAYFQPARIVTLADWTRTTTLGRRMRISTTSARCLVITSTASGCEQSSHTCWPRVLRIRLSAKPHHG